MLNSVGERGEPCGKPCVGVIDVSEVNESTDTLIFLFVMKECIIFVKCVDVCVCNVCRSPICQVLSNACCISNEMTAVCSLLLNACMIV